ncbi:MAG: class I fructose-bisphosphate aldolase, partial [Kosmotogaceae bacterium]
TLSNIVASRPDAMILNPGVIEKNGDLLGGKVSILCRITGASTNYSTKFDYHRITTSVEYALSIGADGVVVMGFIGGDGENASLEIIGKVAEECSKLGMPLITEMLPQAMDHFTDPEYIALGARVAYELGADLIKVYYTGFESFTKVLESVPVPVVIAGGPKGKDAFEMAREALELGAMGVAYGRNVFQADDQTEYVEKLLKTVHG